MRESVARLGAGGSRTKHRYEIGCVEGLEIESGVSEREGTEFNVVPKCQEDKSSSQ